MKETLVASPLFTRITSFCNKHALIAPTDTVVVGFSGGPDSLFLLHVLTAMMPSEQIIAAHLDHGWRPESKDEAAWCKAVAATLGVRCVLGHFDEYAHQLKNRGSKEDQARQARRLFFTTIAQRYKANSVALAHHADDQLETFFIRLIRGSGLQGLAGMQPRQGIFIRPLLTLSKQEIVSFLDAHALPNAHKIYTIDPSNSSSLYLRNRIRHTLLPALTACDQRANNNVHAAIAHIQEVDHYLDEQAQKAYEQLTTSIDHLPAQESLPLAGLQELHPLIRHRVLLLWLCKVHVPFTPSKAFFAEIERFLFQSQASLCHAIAPGWVIHKKHGSAWCKKIDH